MDIVYYRTDSGICPARAVTEAFLSDLSDNKRVKALQKIDATVKLRAEGGRMGDFSAPVDGHHFQKFRIKVGDDLIRIFYIPYQDKRLVLLNAIVKPDQYEGGKGKKVENEIERVETETEGYYEDYLKKPDNYEAY